MAIAPMGPLAGVVDQVRLQAMDRAAQARVEDVGDVPRPLAPTGVDKPGHIDFGDVLADAVASVNDAQLNADRAATDYVTGKEVPVHELMASMTKAELSVQLTTAVVSKAIQAYQELWRTEV